MIYSKKNNTFIHIAKNNNKDFLEVEVGDIKQPDFYPQAKIKRFDNECNASFRLIHDETKFNVVNEGDKIKWKGKKLEAHFYNLGEHGYEFEIKLKEKPKDNKIQFTIQTKDLIFAYQPELTQAEKDSGKFRPENVVGSYAVYMNKKRINFIGGKEYRQGKIGHIFRPKIVDNNGKEVWGELKIEKEILTITIPQDFLNNAEYPVMVDPTFGYDIEGGTSLEADGTIHPFCELYNPYTSVTGDKIIGFEFYANKVSGNSVVQVAAYSIVSNTPVSRLAAVVNISVTSATPQWWSALSLNQTLSAGVTYNVAYGDWSDSNHTVIYFDDIGDEDIQSSYHNVVNGLPTTWSEQQKFTSVVSLYAIYQHPPMDINYSYNIFIDKGKL